MDALLNEVECDECIDSLYPCSHSVVGNIILMAFFGYVLSRAARLIADGSELLMEILDPGLIGGFLLPVLGAVPDAAVILVSCLGPISVVQEQLSVGMGTLAGSTIMLLTIPFAISLFVGRSDIVDGEANEKTVLHKKDLKLTGVSVFPDVPANAWIMCATTLPFFVIQTSAFFYENKEDPGAKEHYYALATFIIALVSFIVYSVYCVKSARSKEQQKRRFDEAREQHLQHSVVSAFVKTMTKRVEKETVSEQVPLIGSNNRAGDDAAKGAALKWKLKAQNKKIVETQGADEEDEEAAGEAAQQLTKKQVLKKSLIMLAFGTLVVAIFSDPMVEAVSNFGKAAGIPAFYVAFMVTPLASNASELIASISFASHKKKKNVSMAISALYGAATMNCTFCLSIMMAMIFFRGLAWTFSAETIAIVVTIWIVALITAKKTIRLGTMVPLLILFPGAIALVALLESPWIGMGKK